MEAPGVQRGVGFAVATGIENGPSITACESVFPDTVAAAAMVATGEEEPLPGQQVVGVRMLCEGVTELHPARPAVQIPGAVAADPAEAAEGAVIAPVTPADFPNVKCLQLSNQNLIQLSNLETFTRLESLRVDNNLLRRIGGSLSCLSSLLWLDLSFNRIEVIEGLEALPNLRDLSLSYNRISSLDGLRGCKMLSVLCITNNQISQYKELGWLRGLPRLRCLCIKGNPFCFTENSRRRILSLLPSLEYLDFRLLSPSEKAAAAEGLLPDHYQQQELVTNIFGEELPPEVQCLNCLQSHRDNFFQTVGALVAATRKALEQNGSTLQQRMRSFRAASADLEAKAEKHALYELRQAETRRKAVLGQLQELSKEVIAVIAERMEEESQTDDAGKSTGVRWDLRLGMLHVDSDLGGESLSLSSLAAMEDRCASLEKSWEEEQQALSHALLEHEHNLAEALATATVAMESEAEAATKLALERVGDLFRQIETHIKAFSSQLATAASHEITTFLSTEAVEEKDPRAQFFMKRQAVHLTAAISVLHDVSSASFCRQSGCCTRVQRFLEDAQAEKQQQHLQQLVEKPKGLRKAGPAEFAEECSQC
ncbi:leucine rich repeat-containing protein [Cyclospora cayetanensis]|uniref:Leucine rich repeat-containing protein n=1 Tax=Cyclospora cayetanensis TaxID=88456 RepID=A0A1D3D8Q6_9EIME|nr:leucine rich repeat-containing protein [Cyclospora cayetanensis]